METTLEALTLDLADLLDEGAGSPVGTRKTRADGHTYVKTNDGWKRMSKHGTLMKKHKGQHFMTRKAAPDEPDEPKSKLSRYRRAKTAARAAAKAAPSKSRERAISRIAKRMRGGGDEPEAEPTGRRARVLKRMQRRGEDY